MHGAADIAGGISGDGTFRTEHSRAGEEAALGEPSASSRIYECRAKGIFRKDHQKPLVGDDVEMDVLDQEKALGNIRELLPRHSQLIDRKSVV